jgi:CBS domain containing-hemolysin-like protein
MIIVLIILLLFSAFFSSAETALTTVSKIRIRALEEGGDKKAALALHVLENQYSKMLTTILISNNVINISASAIATTLALQIGGFMVGIVTAILTISILVFGEIVPKTVASIRSEKLALRYIRFLNFFMTVLTPIIIFVNGLSKGLMTLLKIDYNAKQSTITEDELRTLVDVIHEDGVIETEEKEMINNVFDLGDSFVKDVMVPRVHMSFANVDCNYWELIEIFKKDKYTRLPVYEETTDNIVGFINMKDLLMFDDKDNFNIRAILREAFFTHEYKSIPELLEEMRAATVSIAIVLDEYGDTSGLVTLEDIVEEIIGDIRDEHDEVEISDFQKINDLEYIVEGSIDLDDLNESLGTNIESKEYESLGGYIIEQLGHHPEEGDEVTTDDNIRLVVKTIENNRATDVHIYLPEEKIFEDSEDS